MGESGGQPQEFLIELQFPVRKTDSPTFLPSLVFSILLRMGDPGMGLPYIVLPQVDFQPKADYGFLRQSKVSLVLKNLSPAEFNQNWSSHPWG